MVDDGVDFGAVKSCCLVGLLRRILYRRRSGCFIRLSIRLGSQWLGRGIDRRRSRGRGTGRLVPSKTIIPLSTLNLPNLARQSVISLLFVPDLSDNTLPVSSIQAVDETRYQMRVFRGLFDGGYGRAELSSLSIVVLVQAITSLILE
jgi:hypothetical protein